MVVTSVQSGHLESQALSAQLKSGELSKSRIFYRAVCLQLFHY